MDITQITGLIDVRAFPDEKPMTGIISSEMNEDITITIASRGLNKSPGRKVLHNLIASGAINTVILSGEPAKIEIPNDAILISALMGVAGVEEFRFNRWDAARSLGSIETFLDDRSGDIIVRKVNKE